MNTTPDPTVYVDPCPDKKGDEKVKETCSNCGGDGVYKAPTGLLIRNPRTGGNFPGCFACAGFGYRVVKVSSVRARVRLAANQAKRRRDEAPMRAWLAAESTYRKLIADEEAAYAEQDRREALVTGFIADIGTKIANLAGIITVAAEYNTTNFQGYATTGRMLVITLDDGKVVKWASDSAAGIWGFEQGERIRIVRAIAKGHNQFRGQDQTTLKNVKLEKLEDQRP